MRLLCYNKDNAKHPTSYLGHTLTWEKGRQLKSYDSNTYTYNANGIRTSKTVGGVKHTYTLDGTKILRETWGNNVLIPFYDNEENVCGILYNSALYYFLKNLQGDIIAIVDRNGEKVAEYTYDAWGACTSVITNTELTDGVDIAAINPFRYRGYYYDAEIAKYYLQSRYYDADVGRFLNTDDATHIDSSEQTILHCLFSYCENNCVNKTDATGFATLQVVGYGFQIELSLGPLTFGIEFIWYIVSSIRRGRAWYIPYVYLYGGFGLSSDLTSMISKITKNPNMLFNPKKITKASASISIFAIFGYTGKFNKPEDYEGPFSSVSVTIWNVKAYTALGETCLVVGVGVSTSKFSASTGLTRYVLTSTVSTYMSNVYNRVAQTGKTLKKE